MSELLPPGQPRISNRKLKKIRNRQRHDREIEFAGAAFPFETAKRRAKRNCRRCSSKGFLKFDNPTKLQTWLQWCPCTTLKKRKRLKELKEYVRQVEPS